MDNGDRTVYNLSFDHSLVRNVKFQCSYVSMDYNLRLDHHTEGKVSLKKKLISQSFKMNQLRSYFIYLRSIHFLQSTTSGTNWPGFAKYEKQIRGVDTKDLPAILAIINREMAAVNSDFENRANVLYASYLDKITSSNREDLIATIPPAPYKKTPDETGLNIVSKHCDDAIKDILDSIDKTYQNVKSTLTEKGFTIKNEIPAKVSIPVDMLKRIFGDAIQVAIKHGSENNSEMWQKKGMKVAEASMREEAVQLEEELKSVKSTIALRTKNTKFLSDKMVDEALQKFEHEIERSLKKMNDHITLRFGRAKMMEYHCKDMNKKYGILDCLKINVESIAGTHNGINES